MQAHLLGLQSKMRMYQGPIYDGKPLKDADGNRRPDAEAVPRAAGR